MTLKDLKEEDLETIAYDDLAYIVLKTHGKKMKIQDIFKKVCDLLKLDDKEFENKIADFFELLVTDKRFTMLPEGYWDLSINHTKKVEIDDDEEDLIIEDALPEDIDEEEVFDEIEETDDIVDDDLEDLVVIDPDTEEQEDL